MPVFGGRHSTVFASIALRAGPAQYGIVENSAMTTAPATALEFRQACGYFATGVTVLTAERTPGRVHGMTANSFTSVSLEPLLVLACVAEQAQMRSILNQQRRFGVSVLRAGQQRISEFFAQTEQPDDAEAALGVRFRWTPDGIPVLEDTLVQMACNVVSTYVAGDHTIFLAEVGSVEVFPGDPLIFFDRHYHDFSPSR
jgi:flavin reductase (DIM6/NTAB) family NADH-FMN oxidoreductase RutF